MQTAWHLGWSQISLSEPFPWLSQVSVVQAVELIPRKTGEYYILDHPQPFPSNVFPQSWQNKWTRWKCFSLPLPALSVSHSKHISLFAAFAINSTPLVPLIPNQWVSLLRPVLAAVPLQSHTVTVSFRAESAASRSDPEAEGCQY